MLNLPNILTLVRILVIPIFVLVFYLPITWGHTGAAVIFGLACMTDWLDGYLARSLQQATRFGAFLDPVADKLMVSIALIMIVAEAQFKFVSGKTVMYALPPFLITIPSAIIVSREIIVSALREWMAEIGKRTSIVVSSLGKIKTTLQMLALIVLIYCTPTTSASLIAVGYVLLYAAAILTIWSMVIYLKTAWPEFQIN
ncbi:MAG: CDP-diacylglycerol--glycerol-3-phosphate 3-phosphatidyltransferase [Pseudomonadota bacterium]